MKKNNIGVLITIILLLCIFIPASIYGTYMHITKGSIDTNTNKDFYHEGKLYFYNNNELIGKYTCKTPECGYAKNSIKNEIFEEFNKEEKEIEMINNHYAFIKDGESIILYDIKTESQIITYKEVKNYSEGIENNYYLVKNNNDLWGMIELSDNIRVAIPNNYTYLGLKNNMTPEGKYKADRVIAENASGWHILTDKNNIVTSTKDKIVDYSSYFVETSNNEVYDYNNNLVFPNVNLSDITLIDRLAIALVNNSVYYVYDSKTSSIIDTLPKIENNYEFDVTNDILTISNNGEALKTVALN